MGNCQQATDEPQRGSASAENQPAAEAPSRSSASSDEQQQRREQQQHEQRFSENARYFIGFDCSTQSFSALLIRVGDCERHRAEKAAVVAGRISVSFGDLPQFDSPQGYLRRQQQQQQEEEEESSEENVYHADPRMWLTALDLLLSRAALEEKWPLSRVVAVSGAAQQHATVFLNETFSNSALAEVSLPPCQREYQQHQEQGVFSSALSRAFSPMLARKTSPIWMDSSTNEECLEMARYLGQQQQQEGEEQEEDKNQNQSQQQSSSASPSEQSRRRHQAEEDGKLRCRDISGSIPTARFAAAQIRKFALRRGSAVRSSSTSAWNETRRVHLLSSFLTSVVCGRDAPIEPGDGAGMNLMDLATTQWSRPLADAVMNGVDCSFFACATGERLVTDVLPRLAPSSATVVGCVAPYLVARFGFAPDCSVVSFTGDNPSAFVVNATTTSSGSSSDARDREQQRVVVSLGTSDVITAAAAGGSNESDGSAAAAAAAGGGAAAAAPAGARAIPADPSCCGHVFGAAVGRSRFMTLACVKNGSLAREAFARSLSATDAVDFSLFDGAGNYDAVRAFLAQHPLVTRPFIVDEITPLVPAGVVEKSIGRAGGEGGDVSASAQVRARAFIEAQAFNLKRQLSWMLPGQQRPGCVIMTGGASNSSGIRRIFAEVFGCRVECLEVSDSAALGAAMRAAHAVAGPGGDGDAEQAEEVLRGLVADLCAPVAGAAIVPSEAAVQECDERNKLWLAEFLPTDRVALLRSCFFV